MSKLTLAAAAVVAMTAVSALPAFAQPVPTTDRAHSGPNVNASTYNCGSDLGYLKRVFPADVAAIDKQTRVWVTEVCLGDSMVRSEGNAEYVRRFIAKNRVLVDALLDKSYSAEDVYAVRMMGDDTVNLYVHHFVR